MTGKIIVDASNAVFGRMLSFIAKQALLGKEISIVNIEKAIIIGKEADIVSRFKERRARGNIVKGPFYPSSPERIAKRAVRGMLTYKKERGKEALGRIKFYLSVPPEFEKQEKIKFELKTIKNKTTLKRLCELL